MDITMGISRFKNIDGVSCYMISIMHILQQIPSFRKFIRYEKYMKFIENKITETNNINNFIMHELARAINLSLDNDDIKIAPFSFKKIMGKKNPMWKEIEHQDSQEFYIYLITKLEEECGLNVNYIPNLINQHNGNSNILQLMAINYIQKSEIKDYSPIKNMFVGYLVSNTKCCYCLTNSPCFESFITLPVSIPIKKNTNIHAKYGLLECLDNLIKDEQLDKDNKLTCDICGLKNQSIKKIQIWKAPQILVIQLKRFVTNAFGIQTSKILNPVYYPVYNFDISEYFHQDSPFKENARYDLIGINVHREIGFGSLNAGHYVSIVKNKFNNKWYVYDDAKDPEELEENEIQNRNAYLLFYYKI